jgi:ArsR family transcriptional regulator
MSIGNEASQVAKIFFALSHPLRLAICITLKDAPKSVNELCQLLDTKQYMVSQQLSILRENKIVDHMRVSRHMIYSIASPNIIALINLAFDENHNKINLTSKATKKKETAFSEFARIL